MYAFMNETYAYRTERCGAAAANGLHGLIHSTTKEEKSNA